MAGGASMMQLKSASNLAQALDVMVKASAISAADGSRLTALLQSSSDDSDSDAGAPAAEVYESHSGGIVDTLNGLLEKAEGQLDAATKAETAAKNKFDLLKQALTDEIKFATKDMDEQKKALAEAGEVKAAAEGDLAVTSKDLANANQELAKATAGCLQTAADHEATIAARAEELKRCPVAFFDGLQKQSHQVLSIASSMCDNINSIVLSICIFNHLDG